MFIILSLISLLALFTSLVHRQLARIMEIILLIIAILFVVSAYPVWQKLIVVIVNAITILFYFYNLRQLNGHKLAGAIDESIYFDKRKEDEKAQVLLPLIINQQPIKSLVLINFLPDQDEIYKAFEPQLVVTSEKASLRVLAYRNNGYVDIYDSLTNENHLDVSSAEKGLGEHSPTCFESDLFELNEGKLKIDIQWRDLNNRQLSIKLQEGIDRTLHPSVGLDLLAPVGAGSSHPNYLPFFILNNFDFFRTNGSLLDISIDGKKIAVEGFPVPLPVQSERRNFVRYSMDTEIYEVFPTTYNKLLTLDKLTDSNSVEFGGALYLFEDDKLTRIKYNKVEWRFMPALDIRNSGKGQLSMRAFPDRTYIQAGYQIEVVNQQSYLEIVVEDVKLSQHRDIYERLIFNNIKVFKDWPKNYVYTANYNLETGQIKAEWKNLARE